MRRGLGVGRYVGHPAPDGPHFDGAADAEYRYHEYHHHPNRFLGHVRRLLGFGRGLRRLVGRWLLGRQLLG